MKLKNKLGYALSAIGISMSGSVLADYLYVFGGSDFDGSNGLNIRTNSGDFFVPISDSGWWDNLFFHDNSNKNYIAGTCPTECSSPISWNNYFTFDLSDISGTVTSASLNLYTYAIKGSSVGYQLFDITSPLSEVHASGTNANIYNDLMTGVSYGSFIYNLSDRFQLRSILLNADGISALNSAIGGEFGIGGTVTGGIEGPPPIPEPEIYAMWLTGLGLLGFLGYRRRIKAVTFPFVRDMAR